MMDNPPYSLDEVSQDLDGPPVKEGGKIHISGSFKDRMTEYFRTLNSALRQAATGAIPNTPGTDVPDPIAHFYKISHCLVAVSAVVDAACQKKDTEEEKLEALLVRTVDLGLDLAWQAIQTENSGYQTSQNYLNVVDRLQQGIEELSDYPLKSKLQKTFSTNDFAEKKHLLESLASLTALQMISNHLESETGDTPDSVQHAIHWLANDRCYNDGNSIDRFVQRAFGSVQTDRVINDEDYKIMTDIIERTQRRGASCFAQTPLPTPEETLPAYPIPELVIPVRPPSLRL